MKKPDVSNGVTKNNFLCYINRQLYRHIKLKINKPNFFFYTGDQKFQTNRSKQIEILEVTQLFNSTINRNSTSKYKA